MTMIKWREGNWIISNSIEVTHEILTGQGVFETILVSDQVPLFLDLHLDRLNNSCRILGLRSPDFNVIRSGVKQILATHFAKLGRLRVSLFGGVPEVTLMVSLVDVDPWPLSVSVIISPWTCNENSAITGAKSASYAENAVALNWAKARGYSETLFFNNAGQLVEAATSNVLIVVDGEAITPPLRSGCLPGITRAVLLELGLVRETDIDGNFLERATAAALLSSTRGVQPIHALGEGELEVSDTLIRQITDSYQVRVEQDKENWARLP